MGFISRLVSDRAESSSTSLISNLVDGSASRRLTGGMGVTNDSVMTLTAYYRAISLISGTSAGLPIHVFQSMGDLEENKRIYGHHLDGLLNKRPNDEMDGHTLKENLFAHAVGWGYGCAEIVRAGSKPVELWLLRPDRTKIERDRSTQRLIYKVRDDNGVETTLDQDNVLQISGLGFDGTRGYSPVELFRRSIGMSLAAEQFGASFFNNGARVSGVLSSKKSLTPDATTRLTESLTRKFSGPENVGKIMVVGEDATWTSVGIPPDDAQFIESRKFQNSEFSRITGVPLHMLGDLDRSTNNNIEQQSLEFLLYCLSYWLKRFQARVDWSLLSNEELLSGYFTECNTNAIVWADIETRNRSYAIGRQWGWLSANDVRRAENMRSIGPQGDVYLTPGNMTAADTVKDSRDSKQQKALAIGVEVKAGGVETPVPESFGEPFTYPQPKALTVATVPDSNGGLARFKTQEQKDEVGRKFMVAALDRMTRMEANHARRAAKKPQAFLASLDKFYAKHEERVAEMLASVTEPWFTEAKDSRDPKEVAAAIAKAHCHRSKSQLLEASEVTAGKLAESVASTLEQWSIAIRLEPFVNQWSPTKGTEHASSE